MENELRWLVEQMDGIKAELWEAYAQHKSETMFNAIDFLDSSIEELLCVIDEIESGSKKTM